MKKIKINEPCHEKWNEMTPDEKGRFCDKCQKSVHDFTNKKDDEIVSIIENSEEKVCGRFRKSQLNREIVSHQTIYQNKMGVLGTLIIVGGFTINSLIIEGTTVGKVNIKNTVEKNEIKRVSISGIVVDERTNKGLSFATFAIYNNGELVKVSSSNELGEFSFDLDLNKIGKIELEISHENYHTKKILASKMEKDKRYVVSLELKNWGQFVKGDTIINDSNIVPPSPPVQDWNEGCEVIEIGDVEYIEELGEPVIDELGLPEIEQELEIEEVDLEITLGAPVVVQNPVTYIERNIPEQSPRMTVSDIQESGDEYDLFPNPANDYATVDTKENGHYHVSVYDATGALVYHDEFFGTQIDLPLIGFERGIYFVNILNLDSKKIETKKLVKQ